MEYLEEVDSLRIKESKSSLEYTISSNHPKLTPNSNRKNSDYVMLEVSQIMKEAINKKDNILFIGICGGQSCGKSSISQYLQKNLKNVFILSEKDFFLGGPRERRRSFDDKDDILNNNFDGYSIERKYRLVNINSPRNFDWDYLEEVMKSLKNKQPTKIPFWDKEKNIK